jgi:hypothetical protein
MAKPIPDLKVDKNGVSGTLSFKGEPFFCRVPWEALFAVVGTEDSKGAVWDAAIPDEIRCPP